MACHEKFGLQSIAGYLENGVPSGYGAGAEQVVASATKIRRANTPGLTACSARGTLTGSSSNGAACCGRSRTRRTWNGRAGAACSDGSNVSAGNESPTLTTLPPLAYHQTKRVDHRLVFATLTAVKGFGQTNAGSRRPMPPSSVPGCC